MIRAAVLGSPISHSLSPTLHRSAYRKLGIDGEYTSFEVREDELADFISGCDESWTGFSLTMPLKEQVLEIATQVDSHASRIHSANTLIRRGRDWYATSTDRTGFISLLNSHKLNSAMNILILGAGGTARAALGALDRSDRTITIMRRTRARDLTLTSALESSALVLEPWEIKDVSTFDLVINTVPTGASAEIVRGGELPPLVDVIYHPWPSPLAHIWKERQERIISGIELLIWQGIDQVELMTGESFDREEMFNHLFHTLVKEVG